jgi:hypothetical protein
MSKPGRFLKPSRFRKKIWDDSGKKLLKINSKLCVAATLRDKKQATDGITFF